MRFRRLGGWKGWRRLFLVTAALALLCLVLFEYSKRVGQPFFVAELEIMAASPAQTGTQHSVELYSYYDIPVDDINPSTSHSQRRAPKSWASWEEAPSDVVNLKRLSDTRLISRQEIVPIDIAHGHGVLHRGLWLAVLRRDSGAADDIDNYRLLLLRRASTLKTCPGAWSIVGEHSDPAEEWKDTAHRALREELQLEPTASEPFHLINLLSGHSVLVRTHYKEVQRFEFQATALFAVVLTARQVLNIQPDEEVAAIQWVAVKELLPGQRSYCNPEISALAALVGKLLMNLGYS